MYVYTRYLEEREDTWQELKMLTRSRALYGALEMIMPDENLDKVACTIKRQLKLQLHSTSGVAQEKTLSQRH